MELFKVMISYQYCLAGGRLLEKINIYWTYIVYQRACRTLCVLSHVFLRKVLWSISTLFVDKTLELRKFIMKLLNLLLSQDWEVLFLKKNLIEVKLLCRILLFSIKPQHESAIGIHISPPFWTSLPCPSPSHPSRLIQSPWLSFLSDTANSPWLSILHMVM